MQAPPTPNYTAHPTEEDRQKMATYEAWLNQTNENIKIHLNHHDAKITQLRKHKKVIVFIST